MTDFQLLHIVYRHQLELCSKWILNPCATLSDPLQDLTLCFIYVLVGFIGPKSWSRLPISRFCCCMKLSKPSSFALSNDLPGRTDDMRWGLSHIGCACACREAQQCDNFLAVWNAATLTSFSYSIWTAISKISFYFIICLLRSDNVKVRINLE